MSQALIHQTATEEVHSSILEDYDIVLKTHHS